MTGIEKHSLAAFQLFDNIDYLMPNDKSLPMNGQYYFMRVRS